jgi:hypothetical protein
LDSRTTQISSNVKNTQPNSCIHTKNIFSLIDLSPYEESYKKLQKHVESCKICEVELKAFQLKNLASKIRIPSPQIDTETKEMFEREVSDLFRVFNLNEKELLKKKIKTKIKNIDSLGASFLKNLASRQMLTTYAFGAVLFVVLRQFFN